MIHILSLSRQLTKTVFYKPVIATINATHFAEIIVDKIVCYHGLLSFDVTNSNYFSFP